MSLRFLTRCGVGDKRLDHDRTLQAGDKLVSAKADHDNAEPGRAQESPCDDAERKISSG